MQIKPAKVIEEWVFIPEKLNHKVKAVITHSDGEMYHWSISHFFFPREDAGIYIPSGMGASTLDETRALLFAYADKFTKWVEVNEDY